MAHLIEERCVLKAYEMVIDFCLEQSVRKSDMSEVQDVCVALEIDDLGAQRFFGFLDELKMTKPFSKGYEKACRAYVRKNGNIMKPSYIGRMRSFEFIRPGSNDWRGIDQIARVMERFTVTPQASNLSISIFHPDDLVDGFRPGYVPCLSFIDLKFRRGLLRMKFIFRSCDVGEVGIFDIFYCLRLQREILQNTRGIACHVDVARQAATFFFSRAFFYTRRKNDLLVLRGAIREFLG